MAVAVQQFVAPKSPLDAIAKALSVANEYYGIKHASAAMDYMNAQKGALEQKTAQEQAASDRAAKDYIAQNDPANPGAESARQANSLMLDLLAKTEGSSSQQIQALKDNMNGTPGVTAVAAIPAEGPKEESGALPKGGIAGSDAIPARAPMTIAQMKMALPEDSGLLGLAKADMMAKAAGAKAGSFADKNGIQVAKDYEDKLKGYTGLQNDIAKVESALQTKDKNGNPLITKQQMGDANAAMARIFSPSHVSDATVNRTEYESMPSTFAGAIQKWSTNPTDIGSRDLIAHIIDQAHHIGNVNNQNALKDLDGLDSGYSQLSNMDTRQVASSKSKYYKDRFSNKYPTIGEENPSGGGLTGMGSANAGTAKAKTVTQGGHTYTLNPTTGKYE